ncbi:hypothetical protein LCGC14_0547350 [marine sediment metagenome]|uniref:Uncharacterized protein n=1 Tax=marine sediment metagenome TaxID=412755 RepID=A0A0F9UZ99_9ZZZZ
MVLFRQTFPKQPETKPFSIILWMPSPEKYAVHLEMARSKPLGALVNCLVHGDYFHEDEYDDLGLAFAAALKCYESRCQTELKRYRNRDFWGKVMVIAQEETEQAFADRIAAEMA